MLIYNVKFIYDTKDIYLNNIVYIVHTLAYSNINDM